MSYEYYFASLKKNCDPSKQKKKLCNKIHHKLINFVIDNL